MIFLKPITLKNKEILHLNDYELYVFDCDGVLLDSNKLKSKAFRLTLENYPKNLVENFIFYHESNGGISRHTKLEHFLKNILKKKNYKKEHRSLLQKFSTISFKLLAKDAKLIPGVKDFLKKLQEEKKYTIVCSGADEIDLKKILILKNIDHYFSKIYGGPKTKKEILFNLFNSHKNSQMRGIFFGDAFLDYQAAKEYSLDFIFVSYSSDWKNINELTDYSDINSIHSFRNLKLLVS